MIPLEALSTQKFYQEELLPVLKEMKQQNLEALAQDQEPKITAFLRGRVSVLTELINAEENLRKRQAEEVRKTRIETHPRPTGLVYRER